MSATLSQNRFMEFVVGAQFFCIPLPSVREVIRMPEFTPVPGAPSEFLGMMNLRGQIIGVFDIRKKLGSKGKVDSEGLPVVIVIEEAGLSIGIVVDEVSRVLHAKEGEIRPAPLMDDDPAKKYVDGVFQRDDRLVLLLNLEHLLNIKQQKFLQKSA